MAIYKQKTSGGETQDYHFKFMLKGKFYCGVCKGCRVKKDAEQFEKNIKAKIIELSKQKTVKALVDNFREDITGGNTVFLIDAYELSLKKPRKRQPSEARKAFKRSYWRDFVTFMKITYPDVKTLSDVRRKHAEEYIQSVRENGRFDKQVEFKAKDKIATYHRSGNLANNTCNNIHQTLCEVFEKLYHDAGLIENPFKGIERLNNESESRDAFTEQELVLIRDNANDFIRPLFTIGIATALREGDICTLRWDEVDLKNDLIQRKMLKTGVTVEIPIMPPLKAFLLEQHNKPDKSEYVLPEHASMYQNQRTGVSYRVKQFLESLGIATTKKVPGRSRAVSIKDLHSLRHTFCYYAGVYGIPLLVVRSIVGHMSEEMTSLYQCHADSRIKREKLLQLPDFMNLSGTPTLTLLPEIEPERERLKSLAGTADLAKVKACLRLLES